MPQTVHGEEVESDNDRDILYVALAALSSLRFLKELILKVLEVAKLENLPLFDGIRKGWVAKGKAKGEARGRLDMLFDVLEVKFRRIPDGLRDRLVVLKDHEAIENTLKKAINASTIEEFVGMLEH